jgi:hypothetical protein
MTDLISHPFRLDKNNGIAVRDNGSDEYVSERLALIMSVEPGERALAPLFGIGDPAFGDLMPTALQAQADLFGLDVNIVDVETRVVNEARVEYTVEFEQEDPQDG